VFFYCAL
jgi:hypothetical protein